MNVVKSLHKNYCQQVELILIMAQLRQIMLFQDTALPRGSHVMAKNKLLLDVTRGLNSFELGKMAFLPGDRML